MWLSTTWCDFSVSPPCHGDDVTFPAWCDLSTVLVYGNNDPTWLPYFSEELKPPTSYSSEVYLSCFILLTHMLLEFTGYAYIHTHVYIYIYRTMVDGVLIINKHHVIKGAAPCWVDRLDHPTRFRLMFGVGFDPSPSKRAPADPGLVFNVILKNWSSKKHPCH